MFGGETALGGREGLRQRWTLAALIEEGEFGQCGVNALLLTTLSRPAGGKQEESSNMGAAALAKVLE